MLTRASRSACAAAEGEVGHVNNWRSRVWADACEAARVKAAPYDGRHTYASLLIHEGRALPYVTAALGHASATTTLDHYAHVFDEARLAPALGMVEALETARAELEARGVSPDVHSAPGEGAASDDGNRVAKGKRTTGLEPTTFGLGTCFSGGMARKTRARSP